jgi:hypothetical protein
VTVDGTGQLVGGSGKPLHALLAGLFGVLFDRRH